MSFTSQAYSPTVKAPKKIIALIPLVHLPVLPASRYFQLPSNNFQAYIHQRSYRLGDCPGACGEDAWQPVGGKGVDFCNQLERLLNKKTVGKLFEFVYSLKSPTSIRSGDFLHFRMICLFLAVFLFLLDKPCRDFYYQGLIID